MKKARLKITLACNKKCTYCINKSEEYNIKWKRISSLNQVNWDKYRSIIISGGEPTIFKDLIPILDSLRSVTKSPIYLQTNGFGLTKKLVRAVDDYIDGIGLSIHDIGEFKHYYTRYLDILKIKPIRLYVEKEMFDHNQPAIGYAALHKDFSFRVWSEGEFDSEEDIYLLID